MSNWKIILDGESTPLYAPPIVRTSEGLIDPILTMTVSAAGSLEFRMPPNHPLYKKIKPIASTVTVERDGDWLWSGRVDRIDRNFQGVKTVYAVGLLALLNDTQISPYTYVCSGVRALLGYYIARYNAMVSPDKRFSLGRVDGFDDITDIKAVGEWSSAWEAITDNLLTQYGGYLRVRRENGLSYIDYTADYEPSEQPIEYSRNLLDFAEMQDGGDFFTVAVPVGRANSDGVRCTIKSVANPSNSWMPSHPYGLRDSSSFSLGYIAKLLTFDTIKSPYKLIDAAKLALIENDIVTTRTYRAVDLRDAGANTDRIDCGKFLHVVSAPHGVDELTACTQAVIHIQHPERNEYTVGNTSTAFTARAANDYIAQGRSVRSLYDALTPSDTSEVDEINKEFESIQHRGGRSYTEETIWAVNESLDNDFTGVDLDIRKTADGKYIMLHDDTVSRVTTSSGSIASLTLSQALSLQATTNDIYGNPARLCSYEELLDWLHEVECVAYIKLPDDAGLTKTDVRKIVRLAASHGALNRVRLYGKDTVYPLLRTAVSEINGHKETKAEVGYWHDPTLGGDVDHLKALQTLAKQGSAGVYLHIDGRELLPEDWPQIDELDVPVLAYLINIGAYGEAERAYTLYNQYGITRFITQFSHAGKAIAERR